jgi:hypothetical protein
MMHHYAHRLRREHEDEVKVHGYALASLNGRPISPLFDSGVDLAAIEPSLWPQ